MTYLSQHTTNCDTRAARESGLFTPLARRIEQHRTRRALRRLDARLLDDIGLSETEAACEARRRIWDAPDHWRAGR